MIAIPATVQRARNRVENDRVVRWLSLAVAILLIVGIVAIALLLVNRAAVASTAEDLMASKQQVMDMQDANAKLRSENELFKPSWVAAQQSKSATVRLDSREEGLNTRQAEIEKTESALTSREEAVKKREDAAAANNDDGSWWISKVKECLGRGGSYRAATITDGSLGRDSTCYTG